MAQRARRGQKRIKRVRIMRRQRGRKRNVRMFAGLRDNELIPITGSNPCRTRNLREP